MKVTIVLLAGLALTAAALTAQPLAPSGVTLELMASAEPTLMVVSGAMLFALASVLKRLAA
jgi:hypothetical protein